MNKELDCEIVRDLLPLYHDGVVSDTTKEAVAHHLETCKNCRKEYGSLCADLPEEIVVSSKERFSAFVRRQKHKRFILGTVSVVLAMAMLIGGYFAQSQWMCIRMPMDEIQVHKVFRYKVDDGYRFFLWYSIPPYKQSRTSMSIEHRPEGDVLVIQEKMALLAPKNPVENGHTSRETIGCYPMCSTFRGPSQPGRSETTQKIDSEDCEYSEYDSLEDMIPYIIAVEMNGKTVWSEVEDGDTPVPDYVYAWDILLEQANGKVTSGFYDIALGEIGVNSSDGRRLIWDLDGNVILDTQAGERKS